MRRIDILKQMDAAHLAEFLSTFSTCDYCAFGENGDESCFQVEQLEDIPDCREGIQKYLEEEREKEEPWIPCT